MANDPFGSGDFGASPFDDIFARFFGGAAPQRPAQRIDIGQLLTEQGRELMRDAATQAARWGDPDLDTDHLLWAATRQDSVRRLLTAAGANPDAIASRIEAGAQRGEPRDEAPSLTPSAKRALLDARQVARAFGSSYIGPEHLLFALAVNPESAAGRQLREARVTPEIAAAGGGGRRPGGRRRRAAAVRHPHDRRVQHRSHRDGPRRPDRPGDRPRRPRSSRRSRCCRGGPRTTRC